MTEEMTWLFMVMLATIIVMGLFIVHLISNGYDEKNAHDSENEEKKEEIEKLNHRIDRLLKMNESIKANNNSLRRRLYAHIEAIDTLPEDMQTYIRNGVKECLKKSSSHF